jgi:hypothetical protein
MADKKISELNSLTGANAADGDLVAIVDVSATETKKITRSEFFTDTPSIDVGGTVTADGLRVDTSSTGGFKVEDNGASAGVKITGFQGTTNANVRNLEFHAQDFIVHTGGPTGTTTTKRMKVDSTTGDISFYEDTGTTPKFFWDASAESLGLGATSFAGETLRMERSADMIVGLFSGASNSTFLNMGTTSNRDAGQIGYTQSSNHMFFRVNDAERMRIDSSGNLLVGTTSGTGRIVVRAPGADSADSTVMRLAQENYNTGGASLIKIGTEGNGWSKGAIGFVRTGAYDTGALIFAVNGSSNSDDVTSANERMRIDSSGNVGIGTTSPSFPLSIQSNSSAEALLILGRSADDIGEIAFRENDNSTALGELQYRQDHAILRHRVGDLRFATGGTVERMRITSGGTLQIAGGGNDNVGEINMGNTAQNANRFQVRHQSSAWYLKTVDSEPLVFGTANIERMRIDASGNVGIGTSSPAATLDVNGTIKLDGNYPIGTSNVALGDAALNASITGGYSTAVGHQALTAITSGNGNVGIGFAAGDAITSGSANVAVGTQALSFNTTASNNTAVGYQAGFANTTGSAINAFGYQALDANTTGANNIAMGNSALGANTTGSFNTAMGDSALAANTTANDNVAVGQSALDANTTGASNVALGRDALGANTTASNSTAVGYKAGYNSTGQRNAFFGSEAGESNTSGESNTYIGRQAGQLMTTGYNNTILGRYNGNQGGLDIRTSSNNIVLSDGDGNPRLYINSSGSLLVAKSSQADGATAGHELLSDGRFYHTKSGDHVGRLNRLSTDGDILRFAKDGTTVGSIGNRFGAMYVHSPDGTNGSGLRFFDGVIQPCESNGNDSDNDTDLGQVNSRFVDIYATNGTIQTSDRNEKQDIEALSDAEQRVAVACKGLLRKFRWKDAVAEKGDDARIHFGIIAQDLQAAFEAEGLDAGRYAMFISSTWWEAQVERTREVEQEDGTTVTETYTATETYEEPTEGATERTRMGVRYPELLAFIIAAL